MSRPLDDLVREARGELGTSEAERVDWPAVDAALFDRIDREQREDRGRFVGVGRRWPAALGAVAAAAAIFAFAVHDGREPDAASLVGPLADPAEIGGRIVGIDADAQVLVDGRPALRGATIRLGDVIEARGGAAVIERPGKLTMRIEAGSRAAVTHTDGALVLALGRGAVEAQVVPVPSGEAFAVDIDGSRVAVHGTHLRVARSGDQVTVDLNEGVVAVGNAPRVGSVVGALVTAPAHAEFGALDVSRSLAVRHDAASVLAPVALGPSAWGPREASTSVVPPNASLPAPPAGGSGAAVPTAVVAAGPRAPAIARGEAHAAASSSAAAQPAIDANPELTLQGAVKACMEQQRTHLENVTVLVSTTLHLDLGDDGSVKAARFEPPVAPDVNGCAASAIYRTHFPHGGSATIQVDVSN